MHTKSNTGPPAANGVLLLDFYAAFLAGDADAAVRFLTPDFILHVPGRGANAGEHWGREGLKKFMRNILAYNGGRFEMKVPAMAVADQAAFTREVVSLGRRQDPESLWTLRFMMQYRFKNGKISEAWTIPENQYLYDCYWDPASRFEPDERVRQRGFLVLSSLPLIEGVTNTETRKLVETFYGRFWEGDMIGMQRTVEEDMVFHVPGRSRLAGNYHGWRGYLEFRDKVMELAGDKYKLEIADMAAGDKDVFVKEYVRMNRKWDPAVQAIFGILHFEIRNGRIARINDIPVDTYVYDAFFTPEAEKRKVTGDRSAA